MLVYVHVCVHRCMFRAGQLSQTVRPPTLEVISHRESRNGAALCNVSAHVGAHMWECVYLCLQCCVLHLLLCLWVCFVGRQRDFKDATL